jgi:hypothetical protein
MNGVNYWVMHDWRGKLYVHAIVGSKPPTEYVSGPYDTRQLAEATLTD